MLPRDSFQSVGGIGDWPSSRIILHPGTAHALRIVLRKCETCEAVKSWEEHSNEPGFMRSHIVFDR